MMKWILAIFLLVSLASFGQDDSTKYIWYKFQYGQRQPRGWFDTTAQMPYRDTNYTPARPGALVMRPQDKQFYKWNGTAWSIIASGGGGGSVDTINYIATKTNLRDTASVLRSLIGSGGTPYAGPFNASGTGDTLVNASKNVKRVNPGYGILHDITTSNITSRADTSSANGLVTRSKLRDTAAVLRALVTGGIPLDSAYLDSVINAKPYNDRTVIAPQGSGMIVEGNSISQSGTSPYETYANMMARFIGPVNNYSVGGSSVTIVGTMLRDGHLPLRRTQISLYNNGVNDIRFTKNEAMKQLMGHTIRSFLVNSFRYATVDASAMTQTAGTWTSYNGLSATTVSKTNCLQTTDNGATLSFTVPDGAPGMFISFITNAYNDSETWSDSVQIFRSNGGELIATVNLNKKGPFNNAPYVVWLPASNIYAPITIVNRKAAKLVVDYAGVTSPGGAPALVAEITKVPTASLQPGIGHDWWDTVNHFIRNLVESEFARYGYPVATIDVNNGLKYDDAAYIADGIHPTTKAHAEVLLPQALKKIAFYNRQMESVEYAPDDDLYTASAGIPGQSKTIVLPTISQNSGLNYNVSAVDIGQELTIINNNGNSFTWNAQFWNFIEPDGTTSTLFPNESVTRLVRTAEGFRVLNKFPDSTGSGGGGGPVSNVFNNDLYVRANPSGNVTEFSLQSSGSMDLLSLQTASDASATISSFGSLGISGGSGVNINSGTTTFFGTNGKLGHNVTPSYRFDVYENATNQTTAIRVGNFVSQATHNTTAGPLTTFGVYSLNSSTRASGGNNLMNIGVYGRATDGQINYAVYSDGKMVITAADSAASPTNMMWIDKTTNEVKIAAVPSGGGTVSDDAYDATSWNGVTGIAPSKNAIRDALEALSAGSTSIYTTNGTLSSSRTLSGASNDLTFDNLDEFRVNGNTFIQSNTLRTKAYGSTIINIGDTAWRFGYAPLVGGAPTFNKGSAIVIDTNNNIALGQINTSANLPLYGDADGGVAVNGLLSSAGNFYRVGVITTSTTLSSQFYFCTIDATSGNITISLPSANSVFGGTLGIKYVFKRLDNSGNTVTIQRAGSDTIDGGTSFTLTTQYESKSIMAISTSSWALF